MLDIEDFNDLLDGAQTVTITASTSGYVLGDDLLDVLDRLCFAQ